MKTIAISKILIISGCALALAALIYPDSLTILLFLSFGNLCFAAGFAIYLRIVWKDLKKHKVF